MQKTCYLGIIPHDKCSGCGACRASCPDKAISMQIDSEGFLYPVKEEHRCSQCGICREVCPLLQLSGIEPAATEPPCYAAWHKDELIRKESSSGGVFSALAEHVLKRGGFVCGAAFDEENHLRHKIISREADLPLLRGSKYLQSEIGDVFSEIKALLEKNQTVLFVGTPCQVAGLNFFLRTKPEQLLTVDLVCHGVPSPLVFDRYVKKIEGSAGKKVKSIHFRDKCSGWKKFSITLRGNDGAELYRRPLEGDAFGKGFLDNLFLRPLCTECPFATIQRHSDITLGDFWGIGDFKKELDDDRGTSLLLIHSEKGKRTLADIQSTIFCEEVPLDVARAGNLSLDMPHDRHVYREDFFAQFVGSDCNVGDLTINCLEDKFVGDPHGVGIFNIRLPNNNYGAMLQAYALRKSIERLGYSARVINYLSPYPISKIKKICSLGFYKFREKFHRMTSVCVTDGDLINLNKRFDTFVVGSDQLWNYNYIVEIFKDRFARYFLDFVIPSKNILAYAPSFAIDSWNGTTEEIREAREALKRFSAVSVREKDGVKICKNVFDVEATCVLDPTLLLGEEDYQEIIDSDILDDCKEKYVAFYVLDDGTEGCVPINGAVRRIIERTKGVLLNVKGAKKKVLSEDRSVFHSVPAWLNYIKNSEFIITDSYHGTIFAILFKKQFIVIARNYAGNNRLDSLLSILNIQNRFYGSIDDVHDVDFLDHPIDYDAVYEILEAEREKSLKFLAAGLHKVMPDTVKIQRLEKEFILTKVKKTAFRDDREALCRNIRSLQEQNCSLNQECQALKNSKPIRYANFIKKILKKLGVRRFWK